MEMLVRVHRLTFETRINEKLFFSHPLFEWLVEFCADLYNRLHIGFDGKTAHHRLQGKHSIQMMVEFGTTVMFRVCGKVQVFSMSERWFHGIFLVKKAGNSVLLPSTSLRLSRLHNLACSVVPAIARLKFRHRNSVFHFFVFTSLETIGVLEVSDDVVPGDLTTQDLQPVLLLRLGLLLLGVEFRGGHLLRLDEVHSHGFT